MLKIVVIVFKFVSVVFTLLSCVIGLLSVCKRLWYVNQQLQFSMGMSLVGRWLFMSLLLWISYMLNRRDRRLTKSHRTWYSKSWNTLEDGSTYFLKMGFRPIENFPQGFWRKLSLSNGVGISTKIGAVKHVSLMKKLWLVQWTLVTCICTINTFKLAFFDLCNNHGIFFFQT